MEENEINPHIAQTEKVEEKCETKECNCKKKCCVAKWILYGFLVLSVAVLYVLHFKSSCNVANDRSVAHIPSGAAGNIAFINTDSIWANFEFVKDNKKRVEELNNKLQAQYSAKAATFQNEYNTYLKNGTSGLLTLDEQKKTEALLAEKQKHLMGLDQEFSAQLAEAEAKLTGEIQDTIVAFLKRYNTKTKFTYILGYSKGGGILVADENLDISKDVMKGLNEEYKKHSKK